MRKIFLASFVLLFTLNAKSQNLTKDNKAEVIVCKEFHETKTLREIAESQPAYKVIKDEDRKESEDRKRRSPYTDKNLKNALPVGEDPAMQKVMGTRQPETLLNIWEGQTTSSYPPDPSGAAGPNHYVQAVNSSYQIFTKTGGTVTGGGPLTLGSLLFNSNEGDPIVMYDKYADRWVITEFQSQGSTAGNILFAISKTPDPTGQYYIYLFSSPLFPDYEKFSIWSDGYYMTSNQSTQKVFVFERDSMLAGKATSRSIYQTFTPPKVANSFFCPLPADADGQLPPAGTPCPIFSYEDDGWGTGYVDRINIYKMSVTWGTTPTATITLDAQLPTQSFDASYNSSWNDISQPGTTKKLDGIGGVFTYRAQYRRWTGYNTVVLNNGVKISTTQRSIRWYELRQNTTTGLWSIYQQSTYTPDNLSRWVGSIAMDDNGSIGLAYSVSASSGTYPGIRFTGRLASDTLNKMTFAEQIVVSGSSSQTSTNRFGDYSQTSLDPVDGTLFWHTGEYILNGQPATKIFSFKLPLGSASGIEESAQSLSFVAFQNGDKINIKINNLSTNNELIVDLFDIKGRQIDGKKLYPSVNSLETSFSSVGLAKGTYLVRIGCINTNFQKVAKVVVD
ncbi:MAG: T9SS type A sorting domain-containing protein [Bacteroidetes bacterium]|nr:T9SS type A sorting domain-containing protein [Bacteroidota bacterium]